MLKGLAGRYRQLTKGRPLHWILWHPHQRLWNWALLRVIRTLLPIRALSEPVVRLVVALDTLALGVRARTRRAVALGPAALFGELPDGDDAPVYYFDMGTHRQAGELTFANRVLSARCRRFAAFGFEANRAAWESAARKLAGEEHVTLIHSAVSFEVPESGKLRLYHGADGGLGDSLYRPSDSYEEAPVVRFSAWLRANGIDPARSVCLLRMNIEGAEDDVIRDLVEAGLAGSIAGYFGMWDDVSKIDVRRDREFRALLARHGIRPFTFNGRDLGSPSRTRWIAYDLTTQLAAGLRRLRREA
jgi:FkbM family methyltransferase